MADGTYDFTEAQRARFVNEKSKIAQRLRDLAEQVEQIATHTRDGSKLREPSATISQVTHTVLWGVANLRLDLLADWATGIYEVERYDAEKVEQPDERCTYTIQDPYTECVLKAGHRLPTDGGLRVHISADGVMFS